VHLVNQLLIMLLLLLLQLIDAPGWSNGRDVMTWVKRIFRAYSVRLQEVRPAVLCCWHSSTPSATVYMRQPVCMGRLQQLRCGSATRSLKSKLAAVVTLLV
jgi:hypothetical protein